MHKLSGTQIAILTALVGAEDNDISEAQEVVACHRTSAMKLVQAGMLQQLSETEFEPTELGELVLRRELLTRDLKRTNLAIEEAYKAQKPAMRALMRFTGMHKQS